MEKLCIDEQKNQRKLSRNLAQQVEALRSGTNPGAASSGHKVAPEPVSLENNVPIATKVEDLKQKVARLIEQVAQHNREIGNVSPMMPRAEFQICYWEIR